MYVTVLGILIKFPALRDSCTVHHKQTNLLSMSSTYIPIYSYGGHTVNKIEFVDFSDIKKRLRYLICTLLLTILSGAN